MVVAELCWHSENGITTVASCELKDNEIHVYQHIEMSTLERNCINKIARKMLEEEGILLK